MASLDPALPPAPASVEDGQGAPRFGTYAGCLPAVDLERLTGGWRPGQPERLLVHKRWCYVFVGTPEVAAFFALVDLGYSASAFAMAVDLQSHQVLADAGRLGLPPQVAINPRMGPGLKATFRHHRLQASLRREPHATAYRARLRLGTLRAKLRLSLDLDTAAAAPALTAIAPVDGGRLNVTQKWAALPASGELRAGGRRYRLDGGMGGMDGTNGYLARHTSWRWAFACGRLEDGTPLGLNLVEGFNEARDDVNENAVWLGRALVPVGRARFQFSPRQPLEPWTVRTTDGALELRFTPLAVHREDRDLVLVRSRFVQVLGRWDGSLKVGGRMYALVGVPGVAEDQNAIW